MPYFLSASTHQITSIARFLLAPLFVFVTLVVLLITIVVR